MPDHDATALTRRALLIQLATLFVQGACRQSDDLPAGWEPRELLVTLGRERVATIGEAWLTRRPASRRAIARQLRRRGPDLAPRVATDFADGRAQLVTGWLLAETELLQCALVALDERSRAH